jgi:ABC-type molybdate transport system substrate-binding protein
MRTVLVIICALLSSAAVRAVEITVVTSVAFVSAFSELGPQYERATRNRIVAETGPSMGTTH